jgi:hypothetical protein
MPVQSINYCDKTWQARRDLNPHHPDLESGALAVRATGLQAPFPVNLLQHYGAADPHHQCVTTHVNILLQDDIYFVSL